MQQKWQRGLTLIEILVALTIGVVVLGAAIAFLMNSSQLVRIGQDGTKNTTRAQQALNAMVKELKSVHIDKPILYPITPAWEDLPALPYGAFEFSPYPDTAGQVIAPAVPAARKFASQAGQTALHLKWYPNPDTPEESNSLVFYKAPAPGPGETSSIERITYRLSPEGRLLREVQQPLSSSATRFASNPTPSFRSLADDVAVIQFTYPEFERRLDVSLDGQLSTLLNDQGLIGQTRYINENYRKIIGIRLVMRGAQQGGKYLPGVELNTEVRLRSE